MKLTHFDRTLVHGLGLMSRPSIIADPADHRMLVGILGQAVGRASDHPEMRKLVAEVRRIEDNLGRHSVIAHHVASAMNEFDRLCMAAHWDAARTGKNG